SLVTAVTGLFCAMAAWLACGAGTAPQGLPEAPAAMEVPRSRDSAGPNASATVGGPEAAEEVLAKHAAKTQSCVQTGGRRHLPTTP
ncbi:unnamed protein product, partial [Symbiodinium sp. CCMP2592]